MDDSYKNLLRRQVRQALAHLDDAMYLEGLRAVVQLVPLSPVSGLSRGQALQRALRMAISSLDPASSPKGSATDAYCYRVVHQYAIGKRSMVAIADQLGISERKAYYDLSRGIDALVHILVDLGRSMVDKSDAVLDDTKASLSVRSELARLADTGKETINLLGLVREVLADIRPLSDAYGVTIECGRAEDASAPSVTANRVLLRQAILNVLSHQITIPRVHEIHVQCERDNADYVLLHIMCMGGGQMEEPEAESPLSVAAQILDTLSISWSVRAIADSWTSIVLRLPALRERTVLFVDDNEGLLSLFRRYLRAQPYIVHVARNNAEVQDVLQHTCPDVVVLDIMMPNQDGWEILQDLRQMETCKETKIVICSIINDPNLSHALGSDAFLHKPVDRASLIATLDQLFSSDE